jgi:diguanylate cyclase (GGDEF)-like protein
VATTLASALRQGDRAYRYGGEEFAALLPRTRLDGAWVVAERVRTEVEALGLEHPTNPGDVVTVTVGVVEAHRHHAKPEDAFDSVNALLLHGKDPGRNRVVSPRDVPGERVWGELNSHAEAPAPEAGVYTSSTTHS